LNRQELEQRLETVVNTIQTSEAELKKLREDKKRRILLLHPSDLKNISARIRELEDQVEDNKLARGALEKEIQEFKEKKEPEAAKIRKRLAEELWPAALAEHEKLKRIHGELGPVLEKITALNNEMITLANQHERLIEDGILSPELHVPHQLYLLADMKFDFVPPKSLDVRLAATRERDRLASQFKEQRPVVSKILKHINMAWPVCSICRGELLAWKYELAEDESKGSVNFRCPKHPEQTRDVAFPARAVGPGDRITYGSTPVPMQSAVAVLPPNPTPSHGLATPSLTDQHRTGGKTT